MIFETVKNKRIWNGSKQNSGTYEIDIAVQNGAFLIIQIVQLYGKLFEVNLNNSNTQVP